MHGVSRHVQVQVLVQLACSGRTQRTICFQVCTGDQTCATQATLTLSMYNTDLGHATKHIVVGLGSVGLSHFVPTGMLGDFMVTFVADRRRRRNGSVGKRSDARWRPRGRRGSRSIRVELQQELAHRGERRMLKSKEQYFGEKDRTTTQDGVCLWSELSSVTLTSSSSRRNSSYICTDHVWKIFQVDFMSPVARSRWTDVLLRALQ